jgi:hypothetical protein
VRLQVASLVMWRITASWEIGGCIAGHEYNKHLKRQEELQKEINQQQWEQQKQQQQTSG